MGALIAVDHVLVNLAFFVSVIFAPVTSMYWSWWESWWGRNIVALEACIAGTLFGSFLYVDFGIDSIVIRWVQAIFLALVIVVVAWRMVMIWMTQRRGARSDDSAAAG